MPENYINPVFPLGQIKRDLRAALEKINRLKAEAGEEIAPELESAEREIGDVYANLDSLQKSVDDKLTARIERQTILFITSRKTDLKPTKIGNYSV